MTHPRTGHNVKDKSLYMHTVHVKWKIMYMVTDSFFDCFGSIINMIG